MGSMISPTFVGSRSVVFAGETKHEGNVLKNDLHDVMLFTASLTEGRDVILHHLKGSPPKIQVTVR